MLSSSWILEQKIIQASKTPEFLMEQKCNLSSFSLQMHHIGKKMPITSTVYMYSVHSFLNFSVNQKHQETESFQFKRVDKSLFPFLFLGPYNTRTLFFSCTVSQDYKPCYIIYIIFIRQEGNISQEIFCSLLDALLKVAVTQDSNSGNFFWQKKGNEMSLYFI